MTGELNMEFVDATIERVAEELPGIKINCYSDYFDYLISLFAQGLKEYDDLFGKQLRKR